jgi:hypothetical protein
MTRRGTWRPVHDRGEWTGRRDAGRAHLKAARNALAVADAGDDARLAVQGAILAAIAFGDALTIKAAGIRNATDHQRLVEALRHALGDRFPATEQIRVTRLLRLKDDSAYGHRPLTLADATAALEKAEVFARWAEDELLRL